MGLDTTNADYIHLYLRYRKIISIIRINKKDYAQCIVICTHGWEEGDIICIFICDYSRKIARRNSLTQVSLRVHCVSFMYTRVRGQFRSSSQTPLNLISRGLACTCRNFKRESHRPRQRRFARETRTCTSPPRVVSSSLCLLLFNPRQINFVCAYTTRRYQQSDTQEYRINIISNNTNNKSDQFYYSNFQYFSILLYFLFFIIFYQSLYLQFSFLKYMFIFIVFYQLFFKNGIFCILNKILFSRKN